MKTFEFSAKLVIRVEGTRFLDAYRTAREIAAEAAKGLPTGATFVRKPGEDAPEVVMMGN